jgi:hypothetical protein
MECKMKNLKYIGFPILVLLFVTLAYAATFNTYGKLTSLATDDEFIVWDTTAADVRNITVANMIVAMSLPNEIDGHADMNATAAQLTSTIFYNTGQGAADVAIILPTAAAGYNAVFNVGTAQSNKWGVKAKATDKIYLIAADGTIATGSDAGYARMTAAQVGQSFVCWTIKTDAYDWSCKAVAIGTSTFAAN